MCDANAPSDRCTFGTITWQNMKGGEALRAAGAPRRPSSEPWCPETECRGPRRHRNHVWPRPTVPPLALLCVRLPSPSPNRNRSASAFPQAKVVQEVALAQVLPRAHALCPAVLQEDADWSASVDDLLPAARQMPTPAVHRTLYMSSPGLIRADNFA